MRRTASEIINELEIRVAHLEKKAFLGKIKSSINDVYTKLLRELPLERYRNKYLKEVFGRLNKAMTQHGKSGVSNIDLSPQRDGGLAINYTVNGSNRSFIAGEVRDLYVRMNIYNDEIPILESIVGELEGDPLFFPLLKGETEGLYDQIKDSSFLLQAERKFWSAFEKASSVGAKILKALVKIGIGVALFKLIMAGFILVGGGSAIVGILLSALVGGAIFAFDKANSLPREIGYRQKRAQRVDEEEVLENFLELLEQEGLA